MNSDATSSSSFTAAGGEREPSVPGQHTRVDPNSVWNQLRQGPLKTCMLGSGNWGTTVAKIIAENVKRSYLFSNEVRMYVFEEEYKGRKLTEIINVDHENAKYLPGARRQCSIQHLATPSDNEVLILLSLYPSISSIYSATSTSIYTSFSLPVFLSFLCSLCSLSSRCRRHQTTSQHSGV